MPCFWHVQTNELYTELHGRLVDEFEYPFITAYPTAAIEHSTPSADSYIRYIMEEPVHARPGHPSETRIPLIRTFAAVLPTIAFIFIGLRFHVRQCMVGRIGVDDWLALVAWCIMTSEAALAAWGTTLGFGLHKADINPYLQYKLRAVSGAIPSPMAE